MSTGSSAQGDDNDGSGRIQNEEEQDYFASTGLVRVRVIEIVDVLDFVTKQPGYNKKTNKLYSVHASVGVRRENTVLYKYDTRCKPYLTKGSGQLTIGEEYLFHVSSTFILALSLHARLKTAAVVNSVGDYAQDDSLICVGAVDVPISRLGDGEECKILQWYQMNSPINSEEGLRSAVKLELVYIKDPFCLPTSMLTSGVISPTPHIGAKAQKRQPDDGENFGAFADTGISLRLDKENTKLKRSSVAAQPAGKAKEKDKEKDDGKDKDGHGPFCLAPIEDEDATKSLHSGLVDYCFLAGPSFSGVGSASSLSPNGTHHMRTPSVNKVLHDAAAFSPTGTQLGEFAEVELEIWDRFPQTDYPQSPLPGKIEWFACPQGCQIVTCKNRPNPKPSCFILTATDSGIGMEQFGACLTVFIEYDAAKAVHQKTGVRNAVATVNGVDTGRSRRQQTCWWLPNESRQQAGAETKWIGVAVVMLTRWPFLRQLQAILKHHYCVHILPRLAEWERGVCSSPSNLEGSPSTALYSPLTLWLSDIIIKLCVDLPVPIPGMFSIRLNLPGDHSYRVLSQREKRHLRSIQDNILFRLKFSEALPDTHFSLEELLRTLGPRATIDVVCCAMMQCKILLHSHDITKLPAICDGIRALLYPFHWTHVYLPVVPSPLLDLFEAPVPFMLGTYTGWIPLIPKECLSDVVLVDCDLAQVCMGSIRIPSFPASVDRWLMTACKLIACPTMDQEVASPTPLFPPILEEFIPGDVTPSHFMLQMLFFDTMVNILRFVPECIFFLGPSHPVFNRPLFLEKYTSNEFRPFLESLTDTNIFHQLIDSLNAPDLHMFLEGVRLVNSNNESYEATVMSPNAHHLGRAGLINPSPSLEARESGLLDSLSRHQISSKKKPKADTTVFPTWIQGFMVDKPNENSSHAALKGPIFSFALRTILKLRAANYASIFRAIQQRHHIEVSGAASRNTVWRERILDVFVDCDPASNDDQPVFMQEVRANPHHSSPGLALTANSPSAYFQSLENRQSPRTEEGVRLTSEVFAPKTPRFQEISPKVSSDISKQSPRSFLNSKENFVKKQRASISPTMAGKQLPHILQSFSQDSNQLVSAAAGAPTTPSGPGRFRKSRSVYEVDTSGKAQLTSRAKESGSFNFAFKESQDGDDNDRQVPHKLSRSGESDVGSSVSFSESVGGNIRKEVNLSIDAELAYSIYTPPISNPAEQQQLLLLQSNDVAAVSSSRFPIMFDEECLRVKAASVEAWSLGRLCESLGVDETEAEQAYKQIITPRDNANAHFQLLRLQRVSSRENSVRMLNMAQMPLRLDQEGEGGAAIAQFFQLVITSSQQIRDAELSHLLQSCAKALESSNLRQSLLDILHHKSSPRNHSGGSALNPMGSTDLCQLHTAAFEALASLFAIILQICTRCRDYQSAFALLEVSGSFYHAKGHEDHDCLDDSNNSMDGSNGNHAVEMLSARVCQHPIYQSSLLWRAVMNERLPMPSRGALPTPEQVKSVIFEVHNLLHFMHNIGVNSERSLLFIQAIARDYQLDLNIFYDLQRFTNSMWGVFDSVTASNRDQFDSEGNVVKYLSKDRQDGFRQRGRNEHRNKVPDELVISTNYMQNPDDLNSPSIGTADQSPSEPYSQMKTNNSNTLSTLSSPLSENYASMHSSTNADEICPSISTDAVIVRPHSNSIGSTNSSPTGKSVKFNLPDDNVVSPQEILGRMRKPSIDGTGNVTGIAMPRRELSKENDNTSSPPISRTGSGYWGNIKSIFGKKLGQEAGASVATAASASVASSAVVGDDTPTPSFSQSALERANGNTDNASYSLALQLPGKESPASSQRSNSTKSPMTPFHEVSYASKMFDGFSGYEPISFEDLAGVVTTAIDAHDSWLLTGTAEGTIGITDMMQGRLQSCQTHSNSNGDGYMGVTDVQFVRGGNCYVSACSAGILNVWALPGRSELSDGEEETARSSTSSQPSSTSTFSSMFSSFASKPSLKKKSNWTIRKKKYNITSIRGHTAPITAMLTTSKHPTNNESMSNWFVASGDARGGVLLSSGSCSNANGGVTDLVSSSASASVHVNGAITCFALTRSMAFNVASQSGNIASSVNPNSGSFGLEYLAVGSEQGMVEVHDISTAQTVYRILGHSGSVTGIASIRTHELITSGLDRAIKLWDLRTKSSGIMFLGDRYLEEHVLGPDNLKLSANGPITALTVGGADNSLVLAASSDGLVRMWDLRADFSHPCRKLKGHHNTITSVYWNDTRDGGIQTSSLDGTMRRWDSITGRCVEELQVFKHYGVSSMRLSSSLYSSILRSSQQQQTAQSELGRNSGDVSLRNWLIGLGVHGCVSAFKLDCESGSEN